MEPIEVAAPAGESSSPWSSTVILVRVTTSTGAVGWGQSPTTLMTHPVRESVREVARFFEGKEFEARDQAMADFRRYSFYLSRSMEATSALSGVDIALWDLAGQEVGQPIAELLGPVLRDRVRAYSNGWYSDCRAPEEFAAKARAGAAQGFTAFKFDPFGDAYDGISDGQLRQAVGRVAAVREAVGPGVDLLIECHGRFVAEAALRIGPALEPFGPRFIEEPVHPELSDALAAFRAACRVPVALGERLLTPPDFESFLARGLVDVIQPDITNSGGFTSGRQIGAIAAARSAPVAYHNAFGPIQTAA
ncbi:MAG: mandelate racemase/muconate lactonizing enzyme family protein, partial [Thermoplasmata archaeon]|nr:mandelate racemase/muconate lactonizing enzyme family protein [Thermoplasmata archaeon]